MTTIPTYRPSKKNCKVCGRDMFLYNSLKPYCSAKCANTHKKRGPAKQIKRTPSPPLKGKKFGLRKVSKKRQQRLKGYSEIDLFRDIWNVRPHVSELSGMPLPYGPENPKMWVRQFLHVINKGRAPKLRLLKRNIMLGTPDEHDNQDSFPAFVERKQDLLREFYSIKIKKAK